MVNEGAGLRGGGGEGVEGGGGDTRARSTPRDIRDAILGIARAHARCSTTSLEPMAGLSPTTCSVFSHAFSVIFNSNYEFKFVISKSRTSSSA